MRGISKRYGASNALSDVSFDLMRGEILGLAGENGSGKSTLVKVICGYHSPEAGAEATAWGRRLRFPVGARDARVAVIHQDLGLVDQMTVLENLGIGVGYGTKGVRHVRWRRERETSRAHLAQFGVDLDPDELVANLTPPERAMVAVVRAARDLPGGADDREDEGYIFILDEPTAYLTKHESDQVMRMVKSVAAAGSSVIFISHHLTEVIKNCDRVVVLRDGRVDADATTDGLTENGLIAQMLGRQLEGFYPDPPAAADDDKVVLSVEGLSGSIVRDVSFDVRANEVLGVTGLAGMGQQELPYLITGAADRVSGTVRCGSQVVAQNLGKARAAGIALVPGNRRRDGIWPEATATENISLPVLSRYYRLGWLRRREETAIARAQVRAFDVRPPDEEMLLKEFSGGNQQKVVIAKWLQDTPRVLLLDEPTQGVDAGARREILEILKEVAGRGSGVVVFSSDLEQLANICTRVIVLSRGEIIARVNGPDATEDVLLSICQGGPAATS